MNIYLIKINKNPMNMTHIAIFTLVGVVALLAILCCCMGYAIGSKDDRLNRLTDENKDLKDVIQDMEQEMQSHNSLPPEQGLTPAP